MVLCDIEISIHPKGLSLDNPPDSSPSPLCAPAQGACCMLKFDPGTTLRTDLLWWLRPDGGSRLRSASCEELASLAWSLQVSMVVQG